MFSWGSQLPLANSLLAMTVSSSKALGSPATHLLLTEVSEMVGNHDMLGEDAAEGLIYREI